MNRGDNVTPEPVVSSLISLVHGWRCAALGFRTTINSPFKVVPGRIDNVKENGVCAGGPVTHEWMKE